MKLTAEQRDIILENIDQMQKALKESKDILKDMTKTASEFEKCGQRLKKIAEETSKQLTIIM